METEMGWSSKFCKVTGNNICNFVKRFLPQTYALTTWIILPSVVLFLLPKYYMDLVYFILIIAYLFVFLIYFSENIGAILSKLKRDSFVIPVVKQKSIVYIIPAYLNNEKTVLDETLEEYCKLEYNEKIDVMVIYNCKGEMATDESILFNRWDNVRFGSNGRIRIIKNSESTSKAENVNMGLELLNKERNTCEIIAIMDADHQPNNKNASIAINEMEYYGYDVVQGCCTIRNQDNFLSTFISVEFEDMYNVGHKGRLSLFDIGVFGGSNGYWKADALIEIKMDKSMLTEDIDSSVRATLSGYKIGFSSNIESSELSPLSIKTLEKQRLRWAQGWAEVMKKHIWSCIISKNLSIRQKLGFIYLLGWRECFTYFSSWPLICVIIYIFRGDNFSFSLLSIVGFLLLFFGLIRISIIKYLSKGPISSKLDAYAKFAIAHTFYCLYIYYIQLVSHGRLLLNMNAWVATVREVKKVEWEASDPTISPSTNSSSDLTISPSTISPSTSSSSDLTNSPSTNSSSDLAISPSNSNNNC